MEKNIIWRTIDGRRVPITTNQYMNEKIRNESKKSNWRNYTPKIEYGSEDVVEKYKQEIKQNKHRPILVNDEGDIIDGNHTMKAYQDLNIKPPKLYLGKREDFFKEIQKTNYNEIEAIENMLKNKKAKKI